MFGRIFSALLLGFLALTAVSQVSPVAAQPGYGQRYSGGPGQAFGPRSGVQPLDRLLPGIRRDHPGNFYDAEGPTYGPGGDPHYHLKWMTPDGRVIWYDTDARSGRVLRSSPGRDNFDNHRFDGPPPGYSDRFPPFAPYERGYGRERSFGPGPGYARPFGGYGGRGFGGYGNGGGRGGRWRH